MLAPFLEEGMYTYTESKCRGCILSLNQDRVRHKSVLPVEKKRKGQNNQPLNGHLMARQAQRNSFTGHWSLIDHVKLKQADMNWQWFIQNKVLGKIKVRASFSFF